MFTKLHLDSGCFNIMGSTKIVPKLGLSISPPEKLEPISTNPKQRALQTPNGKSLTKTKPREPPSHSRARVNGGQRPNPPGELTVKGSDGKFAARETDFDYDLKAVNLKKSRAKCSTKWLNYGGCIPAILQALEEFENLDEALKPWEEKLGNKERSVILKEQVNWERALEIFEWFKRKGCYELNVIHYNIVLRSLGRAKQWSLVANLWDEMCVKGIAPINSTFGTLIDAYSKGGLKAEALCWLAKMNKQGMEPDEVTMGIVVQLYKKAGEFRKAEDFFKKWSCKGSSSSDASLSSHTYNTLIDTYGKAGKLEEASEVFGKMLGDGISPTTVTFNTMIHICGNHGHLNEVTSLMQKMEDLRITPDTRTYNILISLHAKHDDIDSATMYFLKMKEASLNPDPVSYRTLLYAYSIRHMVVEAETLVAEMDSRAMDIDEFTQSALTRMFIEAREIEKSWLWFRRFHLEGNMSSECYSANIDAYGERGYTSEAEKVFLCCREAKKPSVLEFNVMIKAYGVGKRYDNACQLFDEMESHVAPDRCSYSSLIQILASADMANEAERYLQKMQGSGFVTDCIPYCAVISSFTRLGQLITAEKLYKEMIGFEIQPDVIVFGILINAFADVGSVKEALAYVDEMRKTGLPGNPVLYNSLIKLYTKVGLLKEAEEMYELLKESDEAPDVYSSNCMIDLYSERSMVGPAEEIFSALKRKKSANEFTFAMMLCMYKKLGRFEEAVKIAKQMRKLGLLTDLLSYNNVLGLYAMCGRFKEVFVTFEEMLKSPVQPDECTFKSLAVVLVKSGVSKQAVGKLEVETKRDPQNGAQRWVSVLSSVVGVGEFDDLWLLNQRFDFFDELT